MANTVQERLKLRRMTLDTWSTREKLALASAVLRSGDQNWSCVSRTIKPYAEANRPPDWFSPRNCAQQYSLLLENVETPKRKKRSAGSTERTDVETPGETIVRKLKEEHVNNLRRSVLETQREYLKTLDEIEAICNGDYSDEQIAEMIRELDEQEAREEQEKQAYVRWLQEREERRLELERAWKPGQPLATLRRESSLSEPSSDADSPLSEPLAVDVPEAAPSPLLTSLLKSPAGPAPSSILHSAITSPLRGVSPTIASLLNSSSVSVSSGSVSPNLKCLVSSALSAFDEQKPLAPSPSQGAPTLSMLLELPPSMPGKPLPVLHVQPPPAPPPYSEHLGPPPPYSLATEYLQKQRAEHAAAQAQLAIRNVEKELLLPTPHMLSHKQPLKADLPDLDDIEEVIAVDTSRSQAQAQAQFNMSDHTYVEHQQQPKPGKRELDVFEFGEEEDNDSSISYLKSSAKRLAKKEPTNQNLSPLKPEAPEDEQPLSNPTQLPNVVDPVVQETKVELESTFLEEVAIEEGSVEEVISVDTSDKHGPPLVTPQIEQPAVELKQESDCSSLIPSHLDQPHLEPETVSDAPIDATLVEDSRNETLLSAASVKRRRATASLSATDSKPSSPISFTEEEKEYRSWKKLVLMVLRRMEGHKSASLFLKPITDDQAPDYSSIVRRPMDLSTIKRNLESGVIRTTAEFQRDVMLMFFNARMYNKTNDVIYQQAIAMQKDCLEYIQVLLDQSGEVQLLKRETRTHDRSYASRSSTQLKRKRTSSGSTSQQ